MLGAKIKELRKEKGITQEQLAKALNVTRSAVALWEVDNTDPDIKNIIAIAKFFGVTTDCLFGLEDEFGQKNYTEEFSYSDGTHNILHKRNKR